MWKKQKRLIAGKKSGFDGGERGTGTEGESKQKIMSMDQREISSSSTNSTEKELTVESRIL
jgi:hypothetical protein